MKRTSLPLSILAIAFLFVSCAAPKPLEYRTFKNFSVQKVGFSSTTIKMDLVYFNPNNFGLQLKSTDIDIFINDVYLGHTVQLSQINLPRNAEFALPVSVDVDMKNMLKNGLNTFFSNQVKVKITGSLKVGKANSFISFPIRYEDYHQFSIF